MKLKLLLIFSILIFLLIGCSNSDERILESDPENDQQQPTYQIQFGEKLDEKNVKPKENFKLGENVFFEVVKTSELDLKSVSLVLSKHNEIEWEILSESKLEVKPEWSQFSTGLPAEVFEQLGEGTYKLAIKSGGNILVDGEFEVVK